MEADTRKRSAALQRGLQALQLGVTAAAAMRRPGRLPQLPKGFSSTPADSVPLLRHMKSSGHAQHPRQSHGVSQSTTAPSGAPTVAGSQRMPWHVSSGGQASCSYHTSAGFPACAQRSGLGSTARQHGWAARHHPCQHQISHRQYHALSLHAQPARSWQAAMRKMQDAWHSSQLTWPTLVLPTWWPAWEAIYRSSGLFIPTLPGMRAAYLDLLSALNLAGAGGKVLTGLAFTAVEFLRTTSRVAAEGFAMGMPKHLVRPTTDIAAKGGTTAVVVGALMAFLETLANLTRAMYLALIFTPVIMTAPLALHFGVYRAEWMELLRRTLEAGGPAFIKWGQWAATRHDVFPPDMCSELELLHSQAPAHSFRHTKRAIQESFGMPLTELFDYIDYQPIASGSIGQIHRARLSYKGAALTGFETGQLVAVKVRHPGVADTILRDFSTMLTIAHLLSAVPAVAHLRLEDTLKQFAAPLKEQVDLAREASNLQRFNYNFRQTQSVQFPVPLYPLVSSEVLVETYEDGDHISRYIAHGDEAAINQKLSIIGSGTMLQMMLMDNLIHSDLHPGNILVRLTPPGGLLGVLYSGVDKLKRSGMMSSAIRARLDNLQQRWLQPQMVLLDVGMATELSDEDQTNMVGLFRSFAAMDGKECGKWALAFSGPDQSCPDAEAFKEDMERTFAELRKLDEGQTWDETQFNNGADTLAHVLELVRLHHVTLPGHICAVVVTTLVLEGWSNKLDPTHSVLSQVQKMFQATNVPWKARLSQTVDHVMTEEFDQQAMVDV